MAMENLDPYLGPICILVDDFLCLWQLAGAAVHLLEPTLPRTLTLPQWLNDILIASIWGSAFSALSHISHLAYFDFVYIG
jgi:hypothetical protein